MRRMFDEKQIEKMMSGDVWIKPTLLAGATGTVMYRKNPSGFIEFKGVVTSLGPSDAIFKMPTTMAPTYLLHLGVVNEGANFAKMNILVNGNVFLAAGTYNLEGVSYYVG